MNPIYVISTLASIVFHLTGSYYNPVEPSLESLIFVVLIMIMVQKHYPALAEGPETDFWINFKQFTYLCVGVQLLLIFLWAPLAIGLQYGMNRLCYNIAAQFTQETIWLLHRFQAYGPSVFLVCTEIVFIISQLTMKDVHYGTRHARLSDTVRLFIEEQRRRVRNRERRMRQRRLH
ncbi:hypothetical protein KR018_008945 [Drosophila ironensis]|nr:hypothetical protein KR018_008945 [Drosophila ironensis]